jgi:hypothetical protein
MRRAEGGAKIFGVFRMKNHDFTPKNHIFSNFRGGGARRVRPPLDPPLSYAFYKVLNPILLYLDLHGHIRICILFRFVSLPFFLVIELLQDMK